MSLQEYRAKRDFKKTREPKGLKAHSLEKNLFVVQKHFASHLHYDFRLELDGTLKSWAVPKGPSLNPQDKRLAVEVEDHPLSYVHFEGEIPADEYGGGQVIVWDAGTWIPPKNASAQLKKGRLEFELLGEKLKGRWILVRTSPRGKSKKHNWLLIKRHDSAVSTEDITLQDESVLDKISEKKKPAAKAKLKKSALFKFEEPELAFLVDSPPIGENWIHEVKYDGYRTLCRKEKSKLTLQTRSGLDWTQKYPELAQECKKIEAASFVIDGEVAWIDEQGHTQFDGLQKALSDGQTKDLVYYLFDIMYLNGVDVRTAPLIERKKILQELIKRTQSPRLIFSEHWENPGQVVLNSACHHDLEGIISKNKNSTYESGRSKNWLKSKCKKTQEFVVGGYTLQENRSLGALLVGGHDVKGHLQYAGRVGTGFDQKTSTLLLSKLKKLAASETPFEGKVSGGYHGRGKTAVWVKPQMVIQIEFGAWTDDKILRHAAFKGLREDKKAKKVMLDEMNLKTEKKSAKKSTVKKESAKLTLSSPDKILFPPKKITKQGLADYYDKMQDWILPYVENRALSLLRCPNGQGKTCFFQKHVETEGHGLIKTKIKAPLHQKNEDVLTINSFEGLHQLVQLGNLEIHSRGGLIKNPDYANLIVFDLDPDPGVTFLKVKEAALELRDLLTQLKLVSFVKTSGGKGLHLHVPIKDNTYTWDEIKNFSRSVCEQLVKIHPDKYTVNILKKNRKGKIFLDYLRNGYGATAITAYSVRAHPQASVALPINWKDVSKLKSADQYTLENVPKLIKKRSDPWRDYFKQNQKIKILDQAKNTKQRGES